MAERAGRRIPAVLGQPVIDPADWRAADLATDPRWSHRLTGSEIESLWRMACSVAERIDDDPMRLLAVEKDDLELGECTQTIRAVADQLRDGYGIALIRGLPIDDFGLLRSAIVYWAFGRHLGRARSNNPEGDLLGHVTDLGKTQDDPNSRGYQTREAMDYHCDQSSIVGLLCVREPREGGISKIASAIAVYNELLRRSPQSVRLLAAPFCWTKHGEADPSAPAWYTSPVFSVLDGKLCVSFGPRHILKGHALPGAPALTTAQRQALALTEAIADELHFGMELRRGDIQFLNNFVTLHTRSAYEDWPEPGRKRLLWRLWLSAPDIRPPTDYVRQWDSGVTVAATRERIVL